MIKPEILITHPSRTDRPNTEILGDGLIAGESIKIVIVTF